jgi:putative heme-binding domain-containing protein
LKGQDLRREVIAVLGQKPVGALRVVTMYNEGKLPPEDLPQIIEAVRSHSTPEIQAATQIMLKNKLLAAPTGEEATRLREFVAQHGNPQRGREIYLDAKKGNCATCHRLEGQGGAVGPDLTRVWETLSFDKRVESILEPSKEIKEGFNTFRVATKDGKILSGLLLSDVAEGVTLKDAQGQEVRIPVAEIDEKGSDPTSLMPAGVVGHLSFEELADLLSFLGNREAQEALRNQK